MCGPPRSGTTWIGSVLGSARDVSTVHEPDNHRNDALALVVKRGLGRFPVLDPDDEAPGLERLWAAAFDHGRPTNRPDARLAQTLLRGIVGRVANRVVDDASAPVSRVAGAVMTPLARPRSGQAGPRANAVKSVHSAFALDWIHRRFEPTVIVVTRHPLSAATSWRTLGWVPQPFTSDPRVRERYLEPRGLDTPGADAPLIARLALDHAVLQAAHLEAAACHPDWIVVSHEQLCLDPVGEFRRLFEAAGLPFGPEVEATIVESNRPGDGYQTARVAADQVDAWKRKLTADEIDACRRALGRLLVDET